jgi:hypothetical protein
MRDDNYWAKKEIMMSKSDGMHRPWRQIAKELSQETDSQRVLELSVELNAALEAQGIGQPLFRAPAPPAAKRIGKGE